MLCLHRFHKVVFVMFSVFFRYEGERRFRPYAKGLSSRQLAKAASFLALLAEVRDIRIIEEVSPLKYYQL